MRTIAERLDAAEAELNRLKQSQKGWISVETPPETTGVYWVAANWRGNELCTLEAAYFVNDGGFYNDGHKLAAVWWRTIPSPPPSPASPIEESHAIKRG